MIYVALILAWLGSLFGVGFWQYGQGQQSERMVWQTRESNELRTANAEIIALTAKIKSDEIAHAEALNTISAKFQEEKRNAKNQTNLLIDRARAGDLRLRDNAARQSAGDRAASTPSASPGGRDDEPGSELSNAATEFLLTLTGEADDVARQLAACQRIVIEDRHISE